MKALKAADLRTKSVEELEEMMKQIHVDQFHARKDFVFRRSTDTSSLRARRHNIARILTVLGEMKKGANS